VCRRGPTAPTARERWHRHRDLAGDVEGIVVAYGSNAEPADALATEIASDGETAQEVIHDVEATLEQVAIRSPITASQARRLRRMIFPTPP
jgi:hypothetical protein